MRSSQFQNELELLQNRFNQTFGQNPICNLRTRACVIMGIAALGMLCKKITQASSADEVSDEIKRFGQKREKLMKFFNQAEKLWNSKKPMKIYEKQ